MFVYKIWFNLKDNSKGHELVVALEDFLGKLKDERLIQEFKILRRSLGFGPEGLGEFNVLIFTQSLEDLEKIIGSIEDGSLTDLHNRVTALVKDFKSGLYREIEK